MSITSLARPELTQSRQASDLVRSSHTVRYCEPLSKGLELLADSSNKGTAGLTAQRDAVKKQMEGVNTRLALNNHNTSVGAWQSEGAVKLQSTIRQEEKRLKDVERTSTSTTSQAGARSLRKQLEAARRGLTMHEDLAKAVREKKQTPKRLARKLEEISSGYGYPSSLFDDLNSAIEVAPAPTQVRHNLKPAGRDIVAEIMARSAEFVQRRFEVMTTPTFLRQMTSVSQHPPEPVAQFELTRLLGNLLLQQHEDVDLL
jgi:paraquat-inducible protein B